MATVFKHYTQFDLKLHGLKRATRIKLTEVAG